MAKKKPHFKNRTLVKFHLKDVDPEDFELGELSPILKLLDGHPAKIISLVMSTEIGNKDYEYYDVRFKLQGIISIKLLGISGYHLEKA